MGSVLNTKSIPASGFTPNVNAAGKMTKPARTATSVSDIITEKAVLVKLSFLFTYEP